MAASRPCNPAADPAPPLHLGTAPRLASPARPPKRALPICVAVWTEDLWEGVRQRAWGRFLPCLLAAQKGGGDGRIQPEVAQLVSHALDELGQLACTPDTRMRYVNARASRQRPPRRLCNTPSSQQAPHHRVAMGLHHRRGLDAPLPRQYMCALAGSRQGGTPAPQRRVPAGLTGQCPPSGQFKKRNSCGVVQNVPCKRAAARVRGVCARTPPASSVAQPRPILYQCCGHTVGRSDRLWRRALRSSLQMLAIRHKSHSLQTSTMMFEYFCLPCEEGARRAARANNRAQHAHYGRAEETRWAPL